MESRLAQAMQDDARIVANPARFNQPSTMEWLETVILSTLVLTFHRTLANVNVVAFDPSARSSHPPAITAL